MMMKRITKIPKVTNKISFKLHSKESKQKRLEYQKFVDFRKKYSPIKTDEQ